MVIQPTLPLTIAPCGLTCPYNGVVFTGEIGLESNRPNGRFVEECGKQFEGFQGYLDRLLDSSRFEAGSYYRMRVEFVPPPKDPSHGSRGSRWMRGVYFATPFRAVDPSVEDVERPFVLEPSQWRMLRDCARRFSGEITSHPTFSRDVDYIRKRCNARLPS